MNKKYNKISLMGKRNGYSTCFKETAWVFEPIDKCSNCQKKGCETLFTAASGLAINHKLYIVRDCEPKTYKQLPKELSKEIMKK